MTTIDLRIKYKFETGLAPTWGTFDDAPLDCNYADGLKDEYAEWLESRYSDMIISKIRNDYMKSVKGYVKTVYYKDGELCYTKRYKEYLEEYVLDNYVST